MNDREKGAKTQEKSRRKKNKKTPAVMPLGLLPFFPVSSFLFPLLVPVPVPPGQKKK
jgi:hypothetical protein